MTAFEDLDEGEIYESDSFDGFAEAMGWGEEKASELADDGDEIEIIEGAPDFVREIDIVGTKSVVIIKDSSSM